MTGPDPVTHPVTDSTTVAQDAQDALTRLFARCAAIADDWEGPQPDKWRAMLADTLAEPTLQSDVARAAFEQHLVTALASGWQPGHDAVFWVAPSQFGWDTDPAALLRHGPAGERVQQALAEQHTFDQQVDRLRFLQRYIAGRLRRPALPSDEELLYRVPHPSTWPAASPRGPPRSPTCQPSTAGSPATSPCPRRASSQSPATPAPGPPTSTATAP